MRRATRAALWVLFAIVALAGLALAIFAPHSPGG